MRKPLEKQETLYPDVDSGLGANRFNPRVRAIEPGSTSKTFEREKSMNKNELVSAVAEATKLSRNDASAAVEAVFSTITTELKNGGDVRLVGFGNFSVSKREATTGRNPQTGAEVKIPARNVPKFSAGKGLKDSVN
jgi:DNA-binding protein HU-beta